MDLCIRKVKVNPEKLKAGFIPEIYATDAALELVAQGVPFRDAYREVGLNLDRLEARDPEATIMARTYTGTTGNLGLDKARAAAAALRAFAQAEEAKIDAKVSALVGIPVKLFAPEI